MARARPVVARPAEVMARMAVRPAHRPVESHLTEVLPVRLPASKILFE